MKQITLSMMGWAVLLTACQNADKQTPEIAGDYCNCLNSLETSMSGDSKNIIVAASRSNTPEKTLEEGILALNEEIQVKVAEELIALNDLEDENSDIGKCMKSVEKKYAKALTKDKKKFMEKVTAEMESRGNCTLTAAFMRIGIKTGGFD